jgi:hypothetical protein
MNHPFVSALIVVLVCVTAPLFAWWISGPIERTGIAIWDVLRMMWCDFVVGHGTPLMVSDYGIDWETRLKDAREQRDEYAAPVTKTTVFEKDNRRFEHTEVSLQGVVESESLAMSAPIQPQGSAKAQKKSPTRRGAKKNAPKTSKKRGKK